jgi:hypothetical protein
MRLVTTLFAALLCLATINAHAEVSAGDPRHVSHEAQVQQVVRRLCDWNRNDWDRGENCSDQLAQMTKIARYSTPVIRAAIHEYAVRNVLYVSKLKKVGFQVDGTELYYFCVLPSYLSEDKENIIRLPAGNLCTYFPDYKADEIVNYLARYLFQVPDKVWVSRKQYDGVLTDWCYYAPTLSLNDKTVCLYTLWPFRIDRKRRVSFIWPNSYRPPIVFRGMTPSAEYPPSQYIAAFDYCSEHYTRRPIRYGSLGGWAPG